MQAFVFITEFCPAKCPFCFFYRSGRTRRKSYMDFKLFEKVCDLVASFNGTTVTLVGGEPLSFSSETLGQYIDIAREHDLLVFCETNGWYLEKHDPHFLMEFDGIFCSLEYLNEKHEQARGLPGVVNKILQYFQTLPNVALTTVALGDNFSHIQMMLDMSMSMGKSYYVKFPKPDPSEMLSWKDALALYYLFATKMLITGTTTVRIADEPSFYTFLDLEFKKTGREKLKNLPVLKTCGAATGHIAVDVEGKVYACVYDLTEKTYLGRIQEMDRKKLWETAISFKHRWARKKGLCKYCPIEDCTGCPLSPQPWAYCPIFNLFYSHHAAAQLAQEAAERLREREKE